MPEKYAAQKHKTSLKRGFWDVWSMWCALSVARMHFKIFVRILSMRSVGMCPRKLASSVCIDRKQIALQRRAGKANEDFPHLQV